MATLPARNVAEAAASASPQEPIRENGAPHAKQTNSATPKPPPAWKIHALPAPIRTYPLPSFYPDNPISLIHLAYAWVSQVIFPPKPQPEAIHLGVWSPGTQSVHVNDAKSIRALWEQGFYGKGSYSRSEPNWLKREQARRGAHKDHVAESFTVQRRNERRQMKWDRARKEQEAILRTRLEEARIAPVGPRELLALPNSQRDYDLLVAGSLTGVSETTATDADFMVEDELSSDQQTVDAQDSDVSPLPSGTTSPTDHSVDGSNDANGHLDPPLTPPGKGTHEANGSASPPKRRKSVRFSPKVESTTFQRSDPPSPNHSMAANGSGRVRDGILTNGPSPLSREPSVLAMPSPVVPPQPAATTDAVPVEDQSRELSDIEHLQLTLEEAFFLVFGLGVLKVQDEASSADLDTRTLLALFRRHSYFPPRTSQLEPDDPFLIHYAVYHHFRSLGWVTRPGIKFGCDWLLYNRGPVFSHAEFAVIVLPSYSDPHWKRLGRDAPQKSWHWLHALNRVQSVAFKTLVLVYVDVPAPAAAELDIASMLRRYRVREFQVRRWLSNRNRDVK